MKKFYLIVDNKPIKCSGKTSEQDALSNNGQWLEFDSFEDWRERVVYNEQLIIDPEQINKVKMYKLQELKNDCNKAIRAGFYVGDKYYQSDSQDQQNLVEVASLFGFGATTVPYESGLRDGNYVDYTLEEFTVVTNAYQNHKLTNMTKLSHLRHAVTEATTIEEVETINYENYILPQ